MLLQEQTSWLLSCSYPSELDRPAGQGAIAGSFESRPLEACSCENANNVEKKTFYFCCRLWRLVSNPLNGHHRLLFDLQWTVSDQKNTVFQPQCTGLAADRVSLIEIWVMIKIGLTDTTALIRLSKTDWNVGRPEHLPITKSCSYGV